MRSVPEDNEPFVEDTPQRIIDRADRRSYRSELQNRFLLKRSEDHDVFDNVFDLPTLMVINNLINDGVIKSVKSHFASGKESKVYLALRTDNSFVAMKIYLTISAEFKNRLQYLAGDPRFSRIKRGSRNLIAIWAKKEYKNLRLCHENKVRVPAPFGVKKNIVLMEFMGDNEGSPSQTLVNTNVSIDDYKQVIEEASKLYQDANLVHADLSEHNMFKTSLGIMLFDFGSAVDIRHPNAKQFLTRDVINVNRFFEKRAVPVLDVTSAVEKITGTVVKVDRKYEDSSHEL